MKRLLTILLFAIIYSFNVKAEEPEITHKNGYIYEWRTLSVRIFPENMSDLTTKTFKTGYTGVNSTGETKFVKDFVDIRKQVFSDERYQQVRLIKNTPVIDMCINIKTRNIDYLRIRMSPEDADFFTKEELDKLFDLYSKIEHPYNFEKIMPNYSEGEEYYVIFWRI